MDDLQKAHKHFAASCFNATWEFIDKTERTPDENETMRRLSEASMFHWLQVDGHTPTNISVGYWQLARVYAISGLAEQALAYAERCIEIGETADLAPFYVGYGYECKARALFAAEQSNDARAALDRAFELAAAIEKEDDRKVLVDDLDALAASAS